MILYMHVDVKKYHKTVLLPSFFMLMHIAHLPFDYC